jgi:hypothetical protein
LQTSIIGPFFPLVFPEIIKRGKKTRCSTGTAINIKIARLTGCFEAGI